jgi:hypothetical protein
MHMKTKTDDPSRYHPRKERAARLRRATQSVLLFAHTSWFDPFDLLFYSPTSIAIMNGDLKSAFSARRRVDAWVHPEVQVKLAHDIQLDAERPE